MFRLPLGGPFDFRVAVRRTAVVGGAQVRALQHGALAFVAERAEAQLLAADAEAVQMEEAVSAAGRGQNRHTTAEANTREQTTTTQAVGVREGRQEGHGASFRIQGHASTGMLVAATHTFHTHACHA